MLQQLAAAGGDHVLGRFAQGDFDQRGRLDAHAKRVGHQPADLGPGPGRGLLRLGQHLLDAGADPFLTPLELFRAATPARSGPIAAGGARPARSAAGPNRPAGRQAAPGPRRAAGSAARSRRTSSALSGGGATPAPTQPRRAAGRARRCGSPARCLAASAAAHLACQAADLGCPRRRPRRKLFHVGGAALLVLAPDAVELVDRFGQPALALGHQSRAIWRWCSTAASTASAVWRICS